MLQHKEVSSLNLGSVPGIKRPGRYPMLIALVFGFFFSVTWFILSVYLILNNTLDSIIWGIFLILSTAAYVSYLFSNLRRLLADNEMSYSLELNASELMLKVVDKFNQRESLQMVLLEDVSYAEYYPFSDSSSLILHAPYVVVELPLWPFGSGSQDILDFLSGRGIKILNVQTDSKVISN